MLDTLQNTLTSILETVLIVVIPALGIYAANQLKAFVISRAKQVDNEYFRTMAEGVTDTIDTVVAATSQTFVNALKSEGNFTLDAQKVAFTESFNTAKAMLNEEAQAFIVKTYGDLDTYIKTQIEALVLAQHVGGEDY